MMEQTWRWFGPDDAVELHEIRQTGATGIVTALHHIPYGVVWSQDEIAKRKAMIEADASLGLRWSVVESLPVAEPIKLADGDLSTLFDNYRESLRNLGALGVTTVCYNFMPVLDWTRTQLAVPLPGGGTALRFNAHEYAAFDCFMLARKGAEAEHAPDVLARAKAWFDRASESDKDRLLGDIMAGLPGAYDRYDIPGLRRMLDRYADITADGLRREPGALPARSRPGRRRSRRPHVHPSRRSAAPAVRPAAHRVHRGRHRLPAGRGGQQCERTDAVHRIARRRRGQRPAGDRAAVRVAHAFRPPAQCQQGAGWFVQEADHLGGDVDMVGGDAGAAARTGATPRRRRSALAHAVPARPRPRTAGRQAAARRIPAIR